MHSSKCKNKPNNAEIFQKIPVYWFLQPFIRSIFLTQNTQLEYGKGGGGGGVNILNKHLFSV